MKIFVILMFLVVSVLSFGQVTYTEFPINKQLVGRDITTNTGDILINGSVNNTGVNYTSIEVELYRNNVLVNTFSNTLMFSGNSATFNFTIPITAELVNYKVRLFGKVGSVLSFEREADELVAGDVYVINGQSNAEATSYLGSANANQSPFIRVYAHGTNTPNHSSFGTPSYDKWYIGQGDGNFDSYGNLGQWGIKLAKDLVDTQLIPIAIFNSAEGGRPISYFDRPNNYQTSLLTNYGRLWYRLNETKLKDKVRAVFWAQGEADGVDLANTSLSNYKNAFITLKDNWLYDYPNIEHIYIFQTRNGSCGGQLHSIKEAQRQIAFENSNIAIMSTQGINNFTPGYRCHYPYTDGYETFADRIFPLVYRDIYGGIYAQEVQTPMITDAYIIGPTTIEVKTDASTLLISGTVSDFKLENASLTDITSSINSITVSGNKIIFNLSSNPGVGAKISYLGQANSPYPMDPLSGFITNSSGIEIVSFYRYPVNSGPTLSIDDEIKNKSILVYPNPTREYVTLKLPYRIIDSQITVLNTIGQNLITKNYHSNSFDIVLPKTSGIYYVIVKHKNEIIGYFKVLKQ